MTRSVPLTTAHLCKIGICTALLSICAWLCIPAPVPFTLQTLGVFLTVGLLGGRNGSLSVGLYLLLGAVGAPVFAGFTGGLWHLLSPTGGYLIGLLLCSLFLWAAEMLSGKAATSPLCMLGGLLVCYCFGTAWFLLGYTQGAEPMGLMTALTVCVFPYIIPDLLKIALAHSLCKRLRILRTE